MTENNLTIPEIMLRDVHSEIPNLNYLIGKLLDGKGSALPDWADWCLVPVSGWLAIAQTIRKDYNSYIDLAHRAEAVGTWQFSKGIYRFDHDFLVSLLSSPLETEIPALVLFRLPEFSVYFDLSSAIAEFPDLDDYLVYNGFFVSLDDDTKNNRRELRIYVPGRGITPLHIGDWSVDIAISRFLAEARKFASLQESLELSFMQEQMIDYMFPIFSRLINLVLYLCSSEPDIRTDRQPGFSRYRPAPVKTKKGLRLFPADKVHIHTVGATVGQLIRREAGAEFEPIEWQGGTKRAHLRRGHWHGYWKGSRQGDREFIFHWIPPLIAGGKR